MIAVGLRTWRLLSLCGCIAALCNSTALAACDERTVIMNQAPAIGQIAAPVASALNSSLRTALGEDYARRVTTYTDTPKGLFQNGRLHLAPNTPQQISIYGALNGTEVGAVVEALRTALASSRGPEHAPVRVRFYRAEVFVVGTDGSRSRGNEECLWDGVLPPTAAGARVAPQVTPPSR
jgi:hypothetical protein